MKPMPTPPPRGNAMKEARKLPPGLRSRLRLLATTDLHMHLEGYDYYTDRADDSVGLVRTAGLIHTARTEARANGTLTLLFDNGDSLQGTPLGDLAVRNRDQPHPLMQAFGHLRYDALGLGNHDFNFGLDPLLSILAQAPCPVLCSNLRGLNGQDLPGIAPFAILDRMVHAAGTTHPIRIGVLSLLPPQTLLWDAHHLKGRLAVDGMIPAARDRVADLKRAGCDVVIALAHCGLDDAPEHEGMENAVVPLAALAGIDAMIAGHTHLLLPGVSHAGMDHVNAPAGEVHGKPVVMPGAAGSHLGVIDLDLRTDADGRWTVGGSDCALRPICVRGANGIPVPATRGDRALSDLLAPGHAATRSRMLRPVGYTELPLHSYFSFIAPDRALATVAAAQAAALRPVLVGTVAEGLPVLSATAPCKFGGRSGPLNYTDVPAGNVSLRHVADLHVFPNELRAMIVTGQQIADWLEASASLYHQIVPGSTHMALMNPSLPGHDFDVLHGLTWQIDLSAPPRHPSDDPGGPPQNPRIGDIRHDDAPVRPDQRFVVALNNYRAGGGGFPALAGAENLPVRPLNIRDIICEYLSGTLPADPLADALPAWRFKPMPGTRVRVRTGPGATAHMHELAGRDIAVSGPGADGFLRLDLSL